MKTIKRDKGFGLVSASMGLAVIAYVAFQLIPIAGRLQLYTYRIATVTGINETAQASKSFYVGVASGKHNPDGGEEPDAVQRFGAWPMDFETLAIPGYLGSDEEIAENRNGYGYPYEFEGQDDALIIKTETPNEKQANYVASHFGGLARVVDGNFVQVIWARPGTDTNHEPFFRHDGTIVMSGDMDLNGNNIKQVGLIEAEIGSIDIFTTNEFVLTSSK